MQGFILTANTKSVEREIKVKDTRSRCLREECVKDNYYARFHPHS